MKKFIQIFSSFIFLFLFISISTTHVFASFDLGDKSPNGNNLTNHGATEVTTDTPFVTSSEAVNLSAVSSQYISVSDNSAWKPTPNITIELWAKFNSLPGSGNYPVLVSNLSGMNGLGWDYFYSGDDGKIHFYVQRLGSSINVAANTTVTTGVWHHYAVTFDGTTVKFYLDGSADGSVNAPITMAYESGQNPLIGAIYFGGTVTRFIDAKIDDVRIWNVVRTGAQINDSKSVELTGTEDGLAAYYPFENLPQPKWDLGDKSTNGNNLTNHGATEWTTDFPFTGLSEAVNLSGASSQYLNTTDNSAWKPSPNITVEFWAKFNSLPGPGNYPALVSNLGDTNGLGWEVFYDGDNGKMRFYVQTSSSSINVAATTSPTTGSWHHYAVTFDGTIVKFYRDGSSDGMITAPITLSYESVQHPLIGALYFNHQVMRFIDAKMDDIRIWNVVRTGTQISTNYNQELIGTESGLAAYYPFQSLLQNKITYYTINDGTNFIRSTSPFSSGVATQTKNSNGSVTVSVNNAIGYADSGFVLYKGALGNLPNFTVNGSGSPFGLNLWFDVNNDNEFFAWNSNGVMTGLNGDTYGLGPTSQSGTDVVTGSSLFYLISDGKNHSFSDLKNGVVSGINANTRVAVWVGVNTNSGSTSATITSISGL